MAALSLLAMDGSAAVKQQSQVHFVPPHCIEVDGFGKPCRAAKYGGYNCEKVHIRIKPLPECREFDRQHFLEIPRL
jgi:hypothetical protein